jgi:hypothetical protein
MGGKLALQSVLRYYTSVLVKLTGSDSDKGYAAINSAAKTRGMPSPSKLGITQMPLENKSGY